MESFEVPAEVPHLDVQYSYHTAINKPSHSVVISEGLMYLYNSLSCLQHKLHYKTSLKKHRTVIL
jgi:hypothetical protein